MTEPEFPRVAGDIALASGSSARLAVEVRNDLDVPVDFLVGTRGLDPAWVGNPVMCGPVAPGEVATAEIALVVPAGSPAGRFPFLVTAEPRHTGTGEPLGPVQHGEAALVVGDASHLLVTLDPPEPMGVGGRRFRIVLDNRTPAPLAMNVELTPTAGLWLTLRHRSVEVPAGEQRHLVARAAVERRLFGSNRRLPFVVTAQGHTTPVRVDGVFVARPMITTGITKLAAVVGIIAIWASLALVALDLVSSHAHKSAVSQLSAVQGGGAGVSTAAPSTSGGSGSGGSGSGSGSSTTTVNASGRVNGVVTGRSPGGVTVTIQPTSLVDESVDAQQFTGSSGSTGKISNVAYELPHAVSHVLTTTSRSDGTWAFAGITGNGYYLVTFSKPGYQTVKRIITAAQAAQAPLSVNLSAGQGAMSGTITGPDGPVPGATVTVTDGTITVATTTPTSGKVGSWSIGGLTTPDTYLVSVSAPGLGLASRLVTLAAGKGATHVDLAQQRGVEALSGRVTTTDSTTNELVGLGGATISVSDGTTTRTVTSLTSNGAGTATDLIGTYAVPSLPVPRSYIVTISQPGYGSHTEKVTLDGTASSQTLDSDLSTALATVTGTVTECTAAEDPCQTQDTKPSQTAGLVLSGDNGTYKTTTNESGAFVLTGVTPGDYTLTVEKFQQQTEYIAVKATPGTQAHSLTIGPLAYVPIIQPTSHIRGRVLDARTTGQVNCPSTDPTCVHIEVTGEGQDFSVNNDGINDYKLPASDSDGLLPGLHQITYTAVGYEPLTVNLEVPLGATVQAPTVALYPDAEITGVVLSGTTDSIPNPTYVAVEQLPDSTVPTTAPDCHDTGTLDSNNQPIVTCDAPWKGVEVSASTHGFDINALQHGNYAIAALVDDSFSSQGWIATTPVRVSLAQGQTLAFDLTLHRKGRIALTLRYADANGLESVSSGDTVSYVIAPGADSCQAFPLSASASTVTAGDAGVVTFPALSDGTYTVSIQGSLPGGTYTGCEKNLGVATDQTTQNNLVLTVQRPGVVDRLIYYYDGAPYKLPAEALTGGNQLTITGTTSYQGTGSVVQTVAAPIDPSTSCFGVLPTTTNTIVGGSTCSGTTSLGQATPFVSSSAILTTTNIPDFHGVSNVTVSAEQSQDDIALVPDGNAFSAQLSVDSGAAPDFRTASVIVTSSFSPGAVSLTTDSLGHLTWFDSSVKTPATPVLPGTYNVQASLPGYDPAYGTMHCGSPAQPVVTTPCAFDQPLQFHVHRSITVVVDVPPSASLSGATVTLTGSSITPITTVIPAGATSVTFPDLSAGTPAALTTYRAQVHIPGFATPPATAPISLVDTGSVTAPYQDPHQDQTITIDMSSYQLGTITGTVTGDVGGQIVPLVGVPVVAVDQSNPTVRFFGTSGANGAYSITGTITQDGLDEGVVWAVTATLPGYSQDLTYDTGNLAGPGEGSHAFGYDTSQPHVATLPLQLDVDPVTVSLDVTDDVTGLEVDGASVTLTSAADATQVYTMTQAAATDPYTICGSSGSTSCVIPPGTYSLHVTQSSHAPLFTTVTLAVAVPNQHLAVVLANRFNTLGVHVGGQTGSSPATDLAGALVEVDSVDSSTSPATLTPVECGVTDSNGNYQPTTSDTTTTTGCPLGSPTAVEGLPDGTYSITASDKSAGYAPATRVVTLAHGQFALIDATLTQQLGTLDVTVRNSGGDYLGGALVTLIAAAGGTGQGQGPQETTTGTSASDPAGGQVTFTNVYPGAYIIKTTGPDGHLNGQATFTVAPGDTTDSTTVTVQEVAVNVKVQTSPATTNVAATVAITPDSGGASFTGSVTADGSTVLSAYVVPDSGYTVTASAPGYDAAAPVHVNRGSSVYTLSPPTLTLSKSGTTTGSIKVLVTRGGTGEAGDTVRIDGVATQFVTGNDGSVTITGLTAGTAYDVYMTPVGSSTAQHQTATAKSSPPTVTYALAAPASSTTVSLSAGADAVFSPDLSGVTVTVTNGGISASGITDASGTVTFTDLSNGTWNVPALSTPQSGSTSATSFSAGASTKSIAVTYGGTVTLSIGVSSGGTGSAYAATVSSNGSGDVTMTVQSSNANGATLRLTNVPDGTYTLTSASYTRTVTSPASTGTDTWSPPPSKSATVSNGGTGTMSVTF